MASFYESLCSTFWEVVEFFGKLAPVPSTVPVSPNQPSPVDKIASVIYNYSNNLPEFAGGNVITVIAKNVIIHKVTQQQANLAAQELEAGSQDSKIELYFAMGCIAIESVFDPNCQNGNTGPGESNPTNNPMGYDVGACQLKLEEIVAPGVSGWASANTFATTPEKCYPYFFNLMGGYLEDAKAMIIKYIPAEGEPHPDSRFITYPEILATGIYNFGPTGMYNDYFIKGTFPSHCQEVIDLANYFAIQDGQSQPYPGLSSQ